MEKNQVWLWYQEGVLFDIFIIREIVMWNNEQVAHLYGSCEPGTEDGKYRSGFFSGMELVSNITDIDDPKVAQKVLELCQNYNVPAPGQIVRIDRFKGSGKWYETLDLDMGKYYNEPYIHEAVKKAIKDRYPALKPTDSLNKKSDSMFIICLTPFHKNSFPVTIWLE
jgi:hypothetical protein